MSKSKLRLMRVSSPFEDRIHEPQRKQNKIIVLSVEGAKTEVSYFNCLNNKLKTLDINTIVEIEVLEHRKTESYSAPIHVLGLLEEYLELRRSGSAIPNDEMERLEQEFSAEILEKYLVSPDALDAQILDNISLAIETLNIDLAYRNYLAKFKHPEDHFGIIIDRDCHSNRHDKLVNILNICREKGIGFYITNPCFDFWLLLHLCDVKVEYANDEQRLCENRRDTGNSSFLEKEISRRAHHKKTIRPDKFESTYFPHINEAITRAANYTEDPSKILNTLGTNIPELFSIIDRENIVFKVHDNVASIALPPD